MVRIARFFGRTPDCGGDAPAQHAAVSTTGLHTRRRTWPCARRPTCSRWPQGRWRASSSAPAARTPTTRPSSWCVTTTTHSTGRPKKKIIARTKGYHGVSVAAATLTGLPHLHTGFDLPGPDVVRADCPHHYRFAQIGEGEEAFAARLARQLQALIEKEGADNIAAFIAEPVMGAGGVIRRRRRGIST